MNTKNPAEPSGERSMAPSQLFTVRVWWEETEERQGELRMQVRHVLTGETRYFRSAAELLAHFTARLAAPGESV
ncbi:MAG: hypothetical protein U0X20_19090 [Caldilineaceae bacterium]